MEVSNLHSAEFRANFRLIPGGVAELSREFPSRRIFTILDIAKLTGTKSSGNHRPSRPK
jgi:hypothetical protein